MDEFAIAAGRLNVTDGQSEVLRRARRGDLQAFETLMHTHERQVYRVALRVLGNVEDAQDAAQEVFLRLHRSLNRIDDERELGPWLYRVTVNICNDLLRTRRSVVSMDDVNAPAVQGDPLAASELAEALSRLPEKQRTAIVLREIEGLSTSEVAEIIGASEMTVRSHISIARTKLRQWLCRRRV